MMTGGYPTGPWQPEVDVAWSGDLNGLWEKWINPQALTRAIDYYATAHKIDVTDVEVKSMLGAALKARKATIDRVDDQPSPNPIRKQSTSERVDEAIIQHLSATDAYAVAVEESARLDAEARRLGARAFLTVKANIPDGQKRVTDSEANRAVDADEAVLEARLASDIAAAQAKAAKARLDHWEHVIEWGRSVYSRETRADTR